MQKYFEITLRLWKLLKPFHGYFYLQLFLTICIQVLSVFSVLYISKIVDNAVLKNWELVSLSFVIYFLILIFTRILDFIVDRKEIQNSLGKIKQYLEEYSLKSLFKLNSSQYTENHSAIRLQVIDRGEGAIQSIIETLFLQALSIILIFITSIVAIGFYSINISILSIFTMIVVIYATYKFTNYWRPKMRENIDNWDKQRKIRVEAFEHLKLIKLFGMEDNYTLKYLSDRLIILNYHIYVWLLNTNFRNIRDIFIMISRYASLVMAIYYFSQGNITIGIVYALFTWTARMYDQLGSVNHILRQLPTNYIYLEKYLDVIDMKPEFEEEGKNKFISGDIEFQNVNFKYPKGEKKF